MTKESRDHQLTIRLPQRLRRALDRQAALEQCSVADVINSILARRYPVKARE